MNYTKGEWRIDRASLHSDFSIHVFSHDYNEGDETVAIIVNSKEAEANAHLIAAAPDMYEALGEAKLQLEYLGDKFTKTGTGESILARIVQAQAKAEGK